MTLEPDNETSQTGLSYKVPSNDVEIVLLESLMHKETGFTIYSSEIHKATHNKNYTRTLEQSVASTTGGLQYFYRR